MLLLFDKPTDMRFGSVKKISDANRLLSLKSFLCDVCSFLCYHNCSLHRRKGSMREGKRSCMEENGSLSRSMEGWEEEPEKLQCFIYTPVFTVS